MLQRRRGRLGCELLWSSRPCVHFNGPGKYLYVGPTDFEEWNYTDDRHLAWTEFGLISDGHQCLHDAEGDFTEYYLPLLPWVNRLRRVVFLNDKPLTEPDEGAVCKDKGYFTRS